MSHIPSTIVQALRQTSSSPKTMTVSKSSSSQLNTTVTKFYEAVTGWDFDALETLFSEDYEHRTHPASANDPPKNKKQGIEFARTIGGLLGHAKLNVRDRRINNSESERF
jgi:hypothetical protein